jgi:hypothetical protein
MIQNLSAAHVPIATARPAAAPGRAAAPARRETPIDRVCLQEFPDLPALPVIAKHREVWDQLAGISAATVTVNSPIGQALVEVVKDLETVDVLLTHHKLARTPEQFVQAILAGESDIAVHGADMRQVDYPVKSPDDLRTLDALYLTHDLQTLGNPPLATALHHMSCLGLRLFKSMGGGAQWSFKYEYTGRGDQVEDMGRYGR